MIKSIVFRLMLKRMIFNTIKMIFFFNLKMNMTSLLNLISEDLACCRFVGAACDSNTNHMTQNLEPTLILRVRDDCNPNHVEVSSVNTRYLIIRAPSEHSDTTARYLHGTYYSTIHGPLYIGHYTWATIHWPLYMGHYTWATIHGPLYIGHYTWATIHWPLYMGHLRRTYR